MDYCFKLLAIGLAAAGVSSPAVSAETQTYTYDALGRLVKVEKSGGINNGVEAQYQYDAAGNRQLVTVTGASTSSSRRVVVVPLLGYLVIPLPN